MRRGAEEEYTSITNTLKVFAAFKKFHFSLLPYTSSHSRWKFSSFSSYNSLWAFDLIYFNCCKTYDPCSRWVFFFSLPLRKYVVTNWAKSHDFHIPPKWLWIRHANLYVFFFSFVCRGIAHNFSNNFREKLLKHFVTASLFFSVWLMSLIHFFFDFSSPCKTKLQRRAWKNSIIFIYL